MFRAVARSAMPHAATHGSRGGDAAALAGIGALYAGAALFLPLGRGVPIGDSATFAWSAAMLVEHGELRLSDLPAMSLVGQLFLAAPVAWIFSPAPVVLNRLTFALSAGAACLFYGWLRRLGFGAGAAFLGTATLVANPIWVAQSVTFDTEIYLLAPVFAGLLAIAHWEASGRRWALWAGCAAIAYAALVRQHALLVALGGVALAASQPKARWKALAPWALPFAALAIYYAWLLGWHGAPKEVSWRRGFLLERLCDPAAAAWPLAADLVAGAHYLGLFSFALAPLFATEIARAPRREAGVALALAAVVVAAGTGALAVAGHPFEGATLMPYLPNIVALSDFILPLGDAAPHWLTPHRARLATTLASGIGAVLLLARLGLVARPAGRASRVPSPATARALALGAGLLVGFAALTGSAAFDRYFLVPFPLVLALALPRGRLDPRAAAASAALLAVVAALSLYFADQRIRRRGCPWDVAHALLAEGYRPRELDGGIEFNSYYTYEYYSRVYGSRLERPWPPWRAPEARRVLSLWPREGLRRVGVHRCPNRAGLAPIRVFEYAVDPAERPRAGPGGRPPALHPRDADE